MTSPVRLFRVVDEMVEAFRVAPGFEASSLMISSLSQRETGSDNEVARSVHYYPADGSFAHARVYGAPRSAWFRHMASRLTRAGYERTSRFDDGAAFRRWLPGARQYAAEMKFLGELGVTDRNTERAATAKPLGIHRRNHRNWLALMNAARVAKIPWDCCAIGFSRQAEYRPVDLMLDVRAVMFIRLVGAVSGEIEVRVSDLSGAAVSQKVAQQLNRELRGAGFRKERSDGPFVATKSIRRAGAAARECTRIFERLCAA